MTGWLFLVSTRADRCAAAAAEPALTLASQGHQVTVVALDDFVLDLRCGGSALDARTSPNLRVLVDGESLGRRGLPARPGEQLVTRDEVAALVMDTDRVVWR